MKQDKIIISISKWCIYSWLIITLFMNIFINKNFSLNNFLISLVIYSIFFIPLYLVIYSCIQNKDYKNRIILSIFSLIPLFSGIYFLTTKINTLKLISPLTLMILVFYFLLNFSVLIKDKSYITLIVYTIINVFLMFALAIIYKNEYKSINMEIYSYNVEMVLLLLMGLISQMIAFAIHLFNLIMERKNKDA